MFRKAFILVVAVAASFLIYFISEDSYLKEHETAKHYVKDKTFVRKNNQYKKTDETVKIFCIIFTAPAYLTNRAKAIHETWAPECTKYKFITLMENVTEREIDQPLPILQPSGYEKEDYKKLTDKLYHTIIDIYSKYNNYDWYLRADDDTFIFMSHLKQFLSSKNASKPVTYGCNFKRFVKDGYDTGGAGYVLSNEAMKRISSKLIENYRFCPNTGIEDVNLASCLRELGVTSESTLDNQNKSRFHFFDIKTYVSGNYPEWYNGYVGKNIPHGFDVFSDTLISFHRMSSQKIRALYSLWTKYQIKKKSDPNLNIRRILIQLAY